MRKAGLLAGRGSFRRGPRRCVHGPGVEVHPEGHLRRRPDPLRQPGQDVPAAAADGHASSSASTSGGAGRTASPRRKPLNPGEPGRPRLRLGHLRPHGALRAGVQDAADLHGDRDARLGERRPGLERRRRRRPPTCRRSSRPPRAATRARTRGRDGAIIGRVSASGSPGTSRTTRSSSSPQFVRSGSKWVIQSAKDYARICNAVVKAVKSVIHQQGRVRRHLAARQQPARARRAHPCRRSPSCAR